MDLGLKGKKAAVAAATTGLGFFTAAALIAEGVQVTICGRGERVRKAADELGAIPLIADLSRPEEATKFVAESRDALGGLDILVANAGGPKDGPFSEIGIDRLLDALHINMLSTVAMCREAVPGMRRQKWGRIVAITSLAARRPRREAIMTTTARAGVTAYLKSMSFDVAADGITVNSVQPGYHRTERLWTRFGVDGMNALSKGVPSQTIGEPKDFGEIITFLCSQQARFVNGTAIQVDGGSYAGMY